MTLSFYPARLSISSSSSFIWPVILMYALQPSLMVNRWIQEGTNEVRANQRFPPSMLANGESHLLAVQLDLLLHQLCQF